MIPQYEQNIVHNDIIYLQNELKNLYFEFKK